MQPEREAPAQVVPRNESKLAAETSGTLLRWTVDTGNTVRRGQVLAQIDPRDAELALQRSKAAMEASEARFALAQAQIRRALDLVGRGFISREAVTQRETDLAVAETEARASRAQFATDQRQLAKTSLRAPFDGFIKERMAQNGETVSPGTVLFIITESGAAEVQATVNPSDVPGLRKSSAPVFETSGEKTPVGLLRVVETISTPARTQIVRLSLPSSGPVSGTSGTLRWREPHLHIPPSLMIRRNGVLGVFLQSGAGTQAVARFLPLPGAQEGRAAPVPASLRGDALVVTLGQAALQEGTPIRAVPAVQETPPAAQTAPAR